ncbi:activating molecule in BECN1-regulated autophagy protein 1-like isoform X1 [Dermacentor albipictus]|uniref:activating molecule in BECN1-regulated autophagy protein 1-like isoform X1 n=1 Tax=Dermacentor albipictus TaxID=60249 RepID=UPI0038FBEAD8
MWTERRRARCPGSAVTLLLHRELGYRPRQPTHALAFDCVAEDRAAHYELEETACNLPQSVRSTFLMAFSPDCTKVASTHGDHRIHVCEVATGKLAHTLEGHPRTPWCLAFHPTSNHILASGCLAGQVRVWDLRVSGHCSSTALPSCQGGSEVWSSREGTVISSLAFHPLEPLLAIATANRVVLWDWRRGQALATCKTASEREKVRFVQFCAPRGDSLVTGITNVDPGAPGSSGPRVLDPLLGPQVGALRVPAAAVDTGSSQRRSILTRLMSMYQHLEGLEELSGYQQLVSPVLEPEEALQDARSYAREVTNYSNNLHRLNQLSQREAQQVNLHGAEDGSSADEDAGASGPTSAAAATGPDSRRFWATFYRLRSICSRLERRMRLHASPMWAPPHVPTATRSGSSRTAQPRYMMPADAAAANRRANRMSSAGSSISSAGPSSTASSSSGRGAGLPSTHPDVSLSLVSLLARLQMSLQSLSSAALTTAVAREQIHQVRLRITEILERLANVSGYRARLTSLREQIYEAAVAAGPWSSQSGAGPAWEAEATDHQLRSSIAAERRRREGEDDTSPSQHWDLAYCLWLVEMSLQLTRQMQRILAADYRLTQLHLNATSTSSGPTNSGSPPSPPSSSSSSSTNHGGHSYRQGRVHSSTSSTSGSPSAAAGAAPMLGRPAGVPATPPPSHRPMECPRLRRHHHQRRRLHAVRLVDTRTGNPLASSSSSSDSLDSSDEESLDFEHMEVDAAGNRSLSSSSSSRRRRRMLRRNRFWPASPPPVVPEEDPSVPEVHVSPPSSPPPVRPTAPVPPRPRSPPLPVILSGGPSARITALDALWMGPPPSTAYFSLLYEGGFRPRLSVYETGPNLTHRIQCWDMTGSELPDIGDAKACLVAPRCKIHNDASVALGGGLLAALVPCGLLGASLCVYSLRPRGTLLHTWSFGANAISVSLSPLARYLVVGFAATRGYFTQEREVVAQIFKLTPPDAEGSSSSSSSCGQLQQVGNLSQPGGTAGQPPVSLNSVRWLPRPGEGLIYGTNRGSLCICRPLKPISKEDGSNGPASRSGPTRDATSPFVMLTDQVDRTARNTTIQVLSTASQTVLPQTQTTGTQTMLRGPGFFTEQEQSSDSAMTSTALSSSMSASSDNSPVPGPSSSSLDTAGSGSGAASDRWYHSC